jgi:hypothetical protein
MEKLKALGGFLMGIVVLIAFMSLIVAFFTGAAWISDHLLTWFSNASLVAGIVLFLVLLPLSVVKRARPFSGSLILVISFIFGITLWMEGFLVTLSTWGIFAVIFGLFFAGIGVVPIAMLASLVHGSWTALLELVIGVILTFGCRIFAYWIVGTSDTAGF